MNRNQGQVPQYQPAYNFPIELQSRLQQLALNDPQEMREIARHGRLLEREAQKSNLRCQELYIKQKMRQIHEEIVLKEDSYYYLRYNGEGNGIYYREVFSAQIQNVKCYSYHGLKEIMWQIVLTEKRTGIEVISPLYTVEDLRMKAKLQRTILVAYDCSDSAKCRSFLWNFLQKKLIAMLKETEVVEIPSKPGWSQGDQGRHFCSMSDEDTGKYTDYMRNFKMQRFENLDAGDTICSLLENMGKIYNREDIGMLLQYRLGALLGRLTGKPCFRNGIVIWGEKAEEIARLYLTTMENGVDTVNLDSDRMEKIRERVCALQDTPVIFLVYDPNNRSVQNRLREVMSWMQTSLIDGKSVNAPFVFCFKRFSTLLPLDDMLVVDASSIRLPKDDRILAKFQNIVVERIEQAGELWVDEIANRYNEYLKKRYVEAVSLARTVKEVLYKMFDEPGIDIMHRINLRELLEAGEEEMKSQLSRKSGRLSEIFREKVINLVDKGTILIADRDKSPTMDEWKYIYYGSQYYYFTENVLCKIGIWAEIDRKSILAVKQELASLSMIKKYKAIGRQTGELHVDFRICNAYGERKDLSGIAILREFWDEIGGIKLWERS